VLKESMEKTTFLVVRAEKKIPLPWWEGVRGGDLIDN
jgi:hypothetical protein